MCSHQSLFTWAASHGATISASVEVRATPIGGFGLFAVSDIAASEKILSLPPNLLLANWDDRTGSSAPSLSSAHGRARSLERRKHSDLNAEDRLALTLLQLSEGDDDGAVDGDAEAWRPYTACLPPSVDTTSFWSERELLALQASQVANWTRARVARQAALHSELHAGSETSLQRWLWAGAMVTSRAFGLPLGAAAARAALGWPKSRSPGGHLVPVLLPVADLINAATDATGGVANVAYAPYQHDDEEEEDGDEDHGEGASGGTAVGVTFRTLQRVRAGSELLISYAGSVSSAVSAMDYGFASAWLGTADQIAISTSGPELLRFWQTTQVYSSEEDAEGDAEIMSGRLQRLELWDRAITLAAGGSPPRLGTYDREQPLAVAGLPSRLLIAATTLVAPRAAADADTFTLAHQERGLQLVYDYVVHLLKSYGTSVEEDEEEAREATLAGGEAHADGDRSAGGEPYTGERSTGAGAKSGAVSPSRYPAAAPRYSPRHQTALAVRISEKRVLHALVANLTAVLREVAKSHEGEAGRRGGVHGGVVEEEIGDIGGVDADDADVEVDTQHVSVDVSGATSATKRAEPATRKAATRGGAARELATARPAAPPQDEKGSSRDSEAGASHRKQPGRKEAQEAKREKSRERTRDEEEKQEANEAKREARGKKKQKKKEQEREARKGKKKARDGRKLDNLLEEDEKDLLDGLSLDEMEGMLGDAGELEAVRKAKEKLSDLLNLRSEVGELLEAQRQEGVARSGNYATGRGGAGRRAKIQSKIGKLDVLDGDGSEWL